MNIKTLFPVLLTTDVAAARGFFERCFGLVCRFESDWYVQLGDPSVATVELAVMSPEHESLPPDGRTPAAGVLLTFEVADVVEAHARLVALDVPMVHGPKDEAWGQRHFMLRGPAGALIDVVQPIAPTNEYAAAYAQA
jgi:catechol 2,3-dioxygenase-like lactoylglutathione lyase family enzyme